MEIKVSIITKNVTDVFSRLQQNIANLRPFFRAVALLVLESIEENFIEGGRPGWLPLSPATIRRRRGSGSPQPLRDTGLLMTSIALMELTPASVEVGTNVPYAGAQNFGTSDGHVPQRMFMMLQPDDIDNVVNIAEDEIMKGIA